MRFIDAVIKTLDTADGLGRRLRGKPAKTLHEVPTPPAPPDPFTSPATAKDAAAGDGATSGEDQQKSLLGDPNHPAQIYGKRSCPWTGRAIQLLQAEGVLYKFINLDESESQSLETDLIRETKQYTVPYVYLRGEFIGGYHQLDEIHRLGHLEVKTSPPGEGRERRAGRIKIEIPPNQAD